METLLHPCFGFKLDLRDFDVLVDDGIKLIESSLRAPENFTDFI